MASEKKRYNLALPVELFDELSHLADAENTTMLEVIRKFIKLGLLLHKQDYEILLKTKEGKTRLLIL